MTDINIKEFNVPNASEYSEFGQPYAAFPISTDPSDSCLKGSLYNNGALVNLGMCPAFMSGKCADNWDYKCDLYVKGLTDIDLLRDFLQQTASKKFCRLSDDSNCSINCAAFSPIDQTSPMVCSYYGNEALIDGNQTMDIGTYDKINLSPTYFERCSLSCTKFDQITPDDPVINNCLSSGLCSGQLTNICAMAAKDGITVNNPVLQQYCNLVVPNSKNAVAARRRLSMSKMTDSNGGNTMNIGVYYVVGFIGALLIALGIRWLLVRRRR
jgi:hypothetical protein